MKISELIAALDRVKAEHGDIEVRGWPYDGSDGPRPYPKGNDVACVHTGEKNLDDAVWPVDPEQRDETLPPSVFVEFEEETP